MKQNNMKELKSGSSYIIEETPIYGSKLLSKAKILEITEKCYRIQFEDNEPIWTYKHEFSYESGCKYKIVEEINPSNVELLLGSKK